MNCQRAQQYILLKFAGELGLVPQVRLQRHLARCGGCRQFEKNYADLKRAVRARQPDADDRTVSAILAYARNQARRQRSARAQTTWHPAWVYSALSVAALIIFLLAISPHLRPAPPQLTQEEKPSPAQEFAAVTEFDDMAEKLDELTTWVELSMLELIIADDADIATWAETEELAQQLLQWEEAQI